MVITSAFQAEDMGSIPITRSNAADIAQSVEHAFGKGEVGSSNLPISTSFNGQLKLNSNSTSYTVKLSLVLVQINKSVFSC